MKVVIAIDSLKGCLTSAEANRAAANGVLEACPDAQVVALTVSDGGEGFTEAIRAACGGTLRRLTVSDALRRPVEAHYLLTDDMAVVEAAQACGLQRLSPSELNPLEATSVGVGEMVLDAIKRGARHIVVGLGGTATCDCGQGMLQLLGASSRPDIRFTVATDVQNPLYGPEGAACVFAPQKGASPSDVEILEQRAQRFARYSADLLGYDRSQVPGAGAAGGLGYAFMQYLNANCRSGIDFLLDAYGYGKLMADADLVITGEGHADRQTLMGKVAHGILRKSGTVPVCLLAGQVTDLDDLLQAGFSRVLCFNPANITIADAMRPEVALRHLQIAAKQLCSTVSAK